MGLMGLIMACYGGLWGILSGLTKSTDHPSIKQRLFWVYWVGLGLAVSRWLVQGRLWAAAWHS